MPAEDTEDIPGKLFKLALFGLVVLMRNECLLKEGVKRTCSSGDGLVDIACADVHGVFVVVGFGLEKKQSADQHRSDIDQGFPEGKVRQDDDTKRDNERAQNHFAVWRQLHG